MRRLGPRAHVVAAIAFAIVVVGGGLVPGAAAQTPDRSDVVLVFDFSASILQDAANRNRFGAALERIANRVDQISADLVAGDTTVSFVRFATRAAGVPGCDDLKLLDSPASVTQFGNCLRSVASAYRKGLTPALTNSIGVDTNYVAAMEQAARHLPAGAVRPAVILFTDGKHDVKGVPVGLVLPARERLFGSLPSFALLPVGMGLDPKERTALTNGLVGLRVIRNMPACVSGAVFEWPQVVFETADEAGNAVAVALQDATCTFTAAPTPSPSPAPTPAAVTAIKLTAGDGRIELAWTPPAAAAGPIVDYRARCRAGDGDWIESNEGVSTEPKATIEGLANGTAYECQVAAVSATATGTWTAGGSVTPLGRPAPPAKPSVDALDHAVRITVAAQSAATRIRYECSSDNGASWPATSETAAGDPTTVVDELTNGIDYVCRAFATNAIGVSDASPLSDAVRPCGSLLECNSALVPVLGGLAALLVGGILIAVVALYRGRTTGYVVAVVDVVHTANVGHGSTLGIALTRAPGTRTVTGIVAERGSDAELRIHRRRDGRFVVRDRAGRHEVEDGDPVVVVDSVGVRHSLVLRAFDTNAASRVATRR